MARLAFLVTLLAALCYTSQALPIGSEHTRDLDIEYGLISDMLKKASETLQKMEDKLKDNAVGDRLKKFFEKARGEVDKVVEKIIERRDDVVNKLKERSEKLKDAINKAREEINSEEMRKKLEEAREKIEEVINKVRNIAKDAIDSVMKRETEAQYCDQHGYMLDTANIGDWIRKGTNGIMGGIMDSIDKNRQRGKDAIDTIDEVLKNGIKWVGDKLKKGNEEIKKKTDEVRDNVKDGVKDGVKDSIEDIKKETKRISDSIEKKGKEIMDEVKEDLKKNIEKIQEKIDEKADEINKNIEKKEEVKKDIKEINDEPKESLAVYG